MRSSTRRWGVLLLVLSTGGAGCHSSSTSPTRMEDAGHTGVSESAVAAAATDSPADSPASTETSAIVAESDAPTALNSPASNVPLVEELKLFDGWGKPEVALFVTGQQKGYIEPCGCAGLANQKGGLARRHTLVRELKNKGWPLLTLDVGNQVRRFGRQAELKFQITVEGLKTIGYDAITFGENDLALSVGEVAAATMAVDEQGTPFLCANAAVLDRSLTPRFRILEAGGRKSVLLPYSGRRNRRR